MLARQGDDYVVLHRILGVLLACSFGIINALWLEATRDLDAEP